MEDVHGRIKSLFGIVLDAPEYGFFSKRGEIRMSLTGRATVFGLISLLSPRMHKLASVGTHLMVNPGSGPVAA